MACLIAAAAPPAFAWDIDENTKLNLQNNYLFYGNSISGSNQSGSYLTPGHFGTDDLSLSTTYRSTTTGEFWETAADGRAVDDVRIESRLLESGQQAVNRYTLKRFYSKFGGNDEDAVVGDYYASLSPYSLGTSLKGARYTRKVGTHLETTALFGMPKSNWDDLWRNNLAETVDRKFYGARAVARFLTDGSVGANAVLSLDSRARYITTSVLSNQKLAGADWTLPTFYHLSLHGESEFSDTKNDNPTGIASRQRGWAHTVSADYSYKRFRSQSQFERVSPEFNTTGGSASPDLISAKTSGEWKVKGPWRLTAAYAWFHNNLNHAQALTSTTRLPEASVRYDGPDWRATLSAETKARDREVVISPGVVRSRTRSVANSVSDRFGPVNATLDYEYQFEDRSDGALAARHHILGLGANSQFNFKSGYGFTPNVRWNLQRDRDNILGNTDQTSVLTVNLSAKAPWGGDCAAGYSRNLVLNAVNPNSDRRSFNASLGYNILNRSNQRIEVRYKKNDNRFSTDGQDFKENVLEASVNINFGEIRLPRRARTAADAGAMPVRGPAAGEASVRLPPAPLTPQDLLARADKSIAARDFAQAKSSLAAAVNSLDAADPLRLEYLQKMGDAAFQEGDFAEAKDSYQEGIRLAVSLKIDGPILAELDAGLGFVLAEQGKNSAAVRFLRKALERNPSGRTRLRVMDKLKDLGSGDAQ